MDLLVKIFIFIFLFFLFSCSPSLEQSFDKIEKNYKINKLDFEEIKRLGDSLGKVYPKSKIEIVYGFNSKSMFVSRIENSVIIDASPDLFDNESFGISSDRIKNICERNQIIYLEIENGRFKTSFSFAQPREWSVNLIFTRDKLIECNENKKKNNSKICEHLSDGFYIVATK